MDKQQSQKKQYTPFAGLYCSFASISFYRSVYQDWGGISLAFLLSVSIIFACLVVSAEYFKAAGVLYSPGIESMFHTMPEMKLQNGKLSGIDKNVNLQIPGKTETIILIDPGNTIEDFESAHALVLMQAEEFLFKTKADRQVLKLPYRHFFRDGRLTGPGILQQLKDMANLAIIPLAVLILGVNFIFVLCRSVLIAAFLKLFRYKSKFLPACRLLVVASTPATLLTGLAMLTGIHLGKIEDVFFAVLFFGYAFFAFYSCRNCNQD